MWMSEMDELDDDEDDEDDDDDNDSLPKIKPEVNNCHDDVNYVSMTIYDHLCLGVHHISYH